MDLVIDGDNASPKIVGEFLAEIANSRIADCSSNIVAEWGRLPELAYRSKTHVPRFMDGAFD